MNEDPQYAAGWFAGYREALEYVRRALRDGYDLNTITRMVEAKRREATPPLQTENR